MRINNNVAAFNAYRNLAANGNAVAKSLEKLSSGLRINRAGDDAAGLVISQNLRAQVGGLTQATRNAQDGISVVQTAEGALNEVHNMLGRMRDLAVQAANTGSNDSAAMKAANDEVTQLKTEIDRIAKTTSFGSTKVLDGTYGKTYAAASTGGVAISAAGDFAVDATHKTFRVTVGSTTAEVTLATKANYKADEILSELNTKTTAALRGAGLTGNEVSFSYQNSTDGVHFSATGAAAFTLADGDVAGPGANPILASLKVTAGAAAASGSGGTFQVGAKNGADERIGVVIGNMQVGAGGTQTAMTDVYNINLTTEAGAQNAIDKIDAAISLVSDTRGGLGAYQNRFESVISNLQVTTENLTASESRIRDTDYSSEMVKFTRGQILNQAATSMLGQANKLPQGVLSLLQG